MYIHTRQYLELKDQLQKAGVELVAVSKKKPVAAIRELYDLGQRDFGENYVQELLEKEEQLPKDIRWHFIGHLQTNKVKYIAPFVHLIHGVDSYKLLKEISRQAVKNKRTIQVLLQVHIATEETKFGLDEAELVEIFQSEQREPLPNIKISGLMGMASFTEDPTVVRSEFRRLKSIFSSLPGLYNGNKPTILSMGMSGDYLLAIEEGSNMVRIGSLIFGDRE